MFSVAKYALEKFSKDSDYRKVEDVENMMGTLSQFVKVCVVAEDKLQSNFGLQYEPNVAQETIFVQASAKAKELWDHCLKATENEALRFCLLPK